MLPAADRIVRFGVFEVDLRSGELRKAGSRLALQQQPFRVLVRLLARPGELVTREDLRAELWPADTFVDFEQGLNAAVKRLREALGDSADAPRFIETFPRRGYRFVASVQGGHAAAPPETHVSSIHLATVLIALLVACSAWAFWILRPAALLPLTRTNLSLADWGLTLSNGGLAISPDGRTVVFAAQGREGPRLYVRRFDGWAPYPLEGTEAGEHPFFSPDGEWVGFGVQGLALKRVPLRSGTPQEICPLTQRFFGASWGGDGRIVFAEWPTGLWRVSAEGGAPEHLVPARESARELLESPEVLPGAHAVLFTRTRQGHASIAAFSLTSSNVRTIVETGTRPRYLRCGHLVYESGGRLVAAPFDPVHLRLGSPAQTMSDDVGTQLRSSEYAVSRNGTLVYTSRNQSLTRLVWRQRDGSSVPLPFREKNYVNPVLSLDRRRLVTTVQEGAARSLWTGTVDGGFLTRLTFTNDDLFSLFTPDGRHVVFTSSRDGPFNMYWISTNGNGETERLSTSPHAQRATSWSPSGDRLLFNELSERGDFDIRELDLSHGRVSRPVIATRANELQAVFSPDGRWIAYQSNDSGRTEVYVQAYPVTPARHQVSTEGGFVSGWSTDGGELYFLGPVGLMAVPMQRSGPVGIATLLFALKQRVITQDAGFDITPVDRRFLVVERLGGGDVQSTLHIVQNWLNEMTTPRANSTK